jgi:hypothetical protein
MLQYNPLADLVDPPIYFNQTIEHPPITNTYTERPPLIDHALAENIKSQSNTFTLSHTYTFLVLFALNIFCFFCKTN